MKAVQWIEKLKPVINNPEKFSGLIEDFVQETIDLVNKRGSSPLAVEGAVREQLQKWGKVEEALDLAPGLMYDSLRYEAPRLWDTYCKVSGQLYEATERRKAWMERRQAFQRIQHLKGEEFLIGYMLMLGDYHEKINNLEEVIRG